MIDHMLIIRKDRRFSAKRHDRPPETTAALPRSDCNRRFDLMTCTLVKKCNSAFRSLFSDLNALILLYGGSIMHA